MRISCRLYVDVFSVPVTGEMSGKTIVYKVLSAKLFSHILSINYLMCGVEKQRVNLNLATYREQKDFGQYRKGCTF